MYVYIRAGISVKAFEFIIIIIIIIIIIDLFGCTGTYLLCAGS